MGLLKRVLPEKILSDAVEIIQGLLLLQATFEVIHPCRVLK